jgi:hypothetical protein
MAAFISIVAILAVISIITNISLLIVNRDQAAQLRRVERDRHITELERELQMNLPAMLGEPGRGLAAMVGLVVGVWLRERYRR